ncbi:hypothetical protein [Cytobacillus oceanisediminis]|uniref:hypothetical protein n=1 Tax=Cytobacillus oceanisediminis TaxID=665099 RepID=UPI0011A9F75E|nr:hypothetical protein [Cytobacillus oceanisediminis]
MNTNNDLVSCTFENMNTYWASRIQKFEKSIEQLKYLPASLIDEEIEWTVLGLLRQFYTLRENNIISNLVQESTPCSICRKNAWNYPGSD